LIDDVQFREIQRFRQWWLWVLLFLMAAALVGVFGYGMVVQLALGHPWGNEPMSDVGLAASGSLAIAFAVGLMLAFYKMKLVTVVLSDSVRVSLTPLFRHTIPFQRIRRCEARTYRPLLDYGGWGIRWRLGWGVAYNVAGNRGVFLELDKGKRVLIGSQRADELAQAIQEGMGQTR